jgi:gliding motility-associated lipoprotein GldH
MRRKADKYLLPLLTILLLFASSCNSDLLYTDSLEMTDETWSLLNAADFFMPVNDTAIHADVSFTIRTGSDYPFRNIFLFVTTTAPDGYTITDTLQYDLADEKGNWYGKGFGDVHELDLSYKSNVYFPLTGTYQFRIRHGMRISDLKGVYDIGIRIQKRPKR